MKKNQILDNAKLRLGIIDLNDMQREVLNCYESTVGDLIVYAPTGSGKTLAFALPLLETLDSNIHDLQAVILVPSRELAIQVFNVLHSLADGLKITSCYGGHSVEDERRSLAVVPDVIVATPGRLLDHVNRKHISLSGVRHLVIDEFDKCLELGFSDEMRHLLKAMPRLRRRVLTSATILNEMPEYVRIHDVVMLDFLGMANAPANRMRVYSVESDENDKLNVLYNLLFTIGRGRSIVFLNHRDAAERVLEFLRRKHVSCGLYHGGMEQTEREKAVAMFRNESFDVLVATDLASRGLDIDGVKNIIHYNLPLTSQVYTHRNGRTARMAASGSVYVIFKPGEDCPDFIKIDERIVVGEAPRSEALESPVVTLYFASGRKEKISRADIVGFLVANGGLQASQIGRIDLSDHYALVAVPRKGCKKLLEVLNASRIKGKRVRISLAEQS